MWRVNSGNGIGHWRRFMICRPIILFLCCARRKCLSKKASSEMGLWVFVAVEASARNCVEMLMNYKII